MTTIDLTHLITPDWSDQALCTSPEYARRWDELWFAHTIEEKAAVAEATIACARCPVRLACLSDALTVEGSAHKGDRHGIRGGLTGYQRRLVYEELARRQAEKPSRRRVAA